MSGNQPSVPDRFVYTWNEVQAIPDRLYSMACLKEEAEQIIADALKRASKIAYAARLIQKSLDEKEVPHGPIPQS